MPRPFARREVLDIRTKLLGKDHWKVTDARIALGDSEHLAHLDREARQELVEAEALDGRVVAAIQSGKYQQGLEWAKRAIGIRARLQGTNHRDYATSLYNFAQLYRPMGAYDQAEPLYRHACEIWKRTLGAQHPDYAIGLNGIATVHQSMGDYAQAEPLYREASNIWKKALGENHPQYATSLNNLAGLYRSMGSYGQAVPLFRQASEIWKRALGE